MNFNIINKIFFTFLTSLVTIFDCKGQNLVPNPSFEDTVSCPLYIGALNMASGWSDYRGSPDYFNSCNTSTTGIYNAGTPANFFGYQNPRSGNSYIGFYTFRDSGNNVKEIAGIQLTQPLVIGQEYFIKMFVSMAFHPTGVLKINVASNRIGAHFSTVPFSYSNEISINNFAHIYSDTVIADTANWVLISDSFIADSTYNYVAFGNFFTDSATSLVYFDSTSVASYYYMDDVSVSTDSLYTVGIHETYSTLNSELFVLYSSDWQTAFINANKLNGTQYHLEVFDLMGKCIFQEQGKISSQYFTKNLSCSGYAKGIYVVNFQTEKERLVKKFFRD